MDYIPKYFKPYELVPESRLGIRRFSPNIKISGGTRNIIKDYKYATYIN